jgi:hypothetical protein
MFNVNTNGVKMGPRTYMDLAFTAFMNPQPEVAPVRTAEDILKMREATIIRPTERRVSEFVLKQYTVEKMADKMFDLALQIESLKRAHKTDEVAKLEEKGKHYETIAEAKEMLEPGFKAKVEALVKARVEGIVRGKRGTIHRVVPLTPVAHGLDGSMAEVAEQPEPVMDSELRDAFSQVADPALLEALNALSMSAQQPGGESSL